MKHSTNCAVLYEWMLVTIINNHDVNTLSPLWTCRNLKLQENVEIDDFIDDKKLRPRQGND